MQGRPVMIKSLRRGNTFVEFNHAYGADLIGAINTEVELINDKAIVRIYLKPVDGNQTDDANQYEDDEKYNLEGVIIRDAYIRNRLEAFIKANKNKISAFALEIEYRSSRQFEAKIIPIEDDSLLFNL
jgi:hypothetical protein